MTASTLGALRRLPVPRTEPPYDDEREAPAATTQRAPWVQGSLALALPAAPPMTRRTPLRLVPDPDPDPHGETTRTSRAAKATRAAKTAASADDYPPPRVHRAWIGRLVQALVEVLSGERSPQQVLPWASDEVYTAVSLHWSTQTRRRPYTDLTRRPPLQLRSVHVSQPSPDVAEACALFRRGERTRAVAVRLEAHRGRWRCAAFELA